MGGYTRVITLAEWTEGKSGATGTAALGAKASSTGNANSGGDETSVAVRMGKSSMGLAVLVSCLVVLLRC